MDSAWAVGRKPKLLIVDDDFGTLRALRRLLQPQYEVLLATDTAGAMRAIDQHVPDVVVIDMLLGLESGADTIAKIKEKGPRAVIVAVTGSPSWELKRLAYEVGARAFVDRVDLSLLPGILEYLSMH